MTPSLPNRGMSAAFKCCACSIRQRSGLPFFVRMPRERLLEDVQRLAVAAVADRVDRQLVVVLMHAAPPCVECRRAISVFMPLVRREIGVRLEHPRAARPERAVDRALDAADGESLVAVVDRRGISACRPRACPASRAASSRRAAAACLRRPPSSSRSIVGGGDPASAHRRQPFRERFARRELDDRAQVGFRPVRTYAWSDREPARRR